MCGIAMVRLLKPLDYYQEKYGTWQYGLQKMYLLMEKQHNRGQEGAGLATVKLDMPAGEEYIWRERVEGKNAIQEIFATINKKMSNATADVYRNVAKSKEELPFAGELYLGHLRYSTTGRSGLSYVHPFLRRHNWKNRTLVLAGNFNLTNVDELFDHLTLKGQHPRDKGDTFLMLESLGFQLDQEVQKEYDIIKKRYSNDLVITQKIEENLDIASFIRKSEKMWDGGYVICGMLGHGDSFVFRDPKGIRPAFYYISDEIVVTASERPVIQTAMNVKEEDIKELQPGEAMIIKKDGTVKFETIRSAAPELAKCSFERIYFSRGSDIDIYRERKQLGESLAQPILKAIDNDIENTVFSFIPNTAEVAFYGMKDGIKASTKVPIRVEKVLIKDIKLRTFISSNNERDDLATHVYDVTYGSIRRGKVDNLVCIDDSIVRGTTLKQSILKILNRLEPKKIVIVSSSPQVRFPDYYGIDMARMNEFCAFRAAIELLKESGRQSLIDAVYHKSKAQENLPKEQVVNYVTEIYEPFTQDEISKKIAEMLTPGDVNCPVELVYQTIDGLHKACPNHTGDWYFSGNYPTPGGNRLVNKAFINYYEGRDNN
ncbi:Amidophosphoribosyltransferase [Paludibacter propionicigenes WB4]|uniref:Amidophosphoribosyltransferase n=1 Tax=Paludibacter propionicigenes (strain DSM 17365 / JCM 13257 / WB4) TaxID=694427 RepID=E4T2K9_PALPW|nr:amidophosphoribosyltransferase [Paludibacter propionicigenes]ADQ78953.1 Amidophosphoribosyltransferase [Paludibacter propionicigenes WB4]